MKNAVFILALLSSVPWAHAYVLNRIPSGKVLHWDRGQQLNWTINSDNSSNVAQDLVFRSVSQALQKWKVASDAEFGFDVWMGTDPDIYYSNSEMNGRSSIYFSSHRDGEGGNLGPGVIGLTQVWYQEEDGKILESDTELNDLYFDFTDDPSDTSGYGSGKSGYSRKVYLGSVVTHELGHALGLSHSGQAQASMFYLETPDQSTVSCDDQAGAKTIFRGNSSSEDLSSVQGRVIDPDGEPLAGANVSLISGQRGNVFASVITDAKGKYAFQNVEPGFYAVMAEPFYPGSENLTSGYEYIQNQVCNGGKQNFARTFLRQDSRRPWIQWIKAKPGKSSSVPTFSVDCTSNGGMKIVDRPDSIAWDELNSSGWLGWVEDFSTGNENQIVLNDWSGALEAKVLSYSLFSPAAISLSLEDPEGVAQGLQRTYPTYRSDSGFGIYDMSATSQALRTAEYTFRMKMRPVGARYFPGGLLQMDSSTFGLIILHEESGNNSSSSFYAEGAKCRVEVEDNYRSPAGDPPENPGIGFCSSVRQKGQPPEDSKPLVFLFFNWMLPWALMLLIPRFNLRSMKLKFLSLLILMIGSSANSSTTPLVKSEEIHTAASKKTEFYIKDGLFTGGDESIADVVVLGIKRGGDIGKAGNPGYERVVVQLEGNRQGESTPLSRPPYYQVGVTEALARVQVTIQGAPKLAFNAKKVAEIFHTSKVVKNIDLYPVIEKGRWSFVLNLSSARPVEVFELSNPARIVLDIKSGP